MWLFIAMMMLWGWSAVIVALLPPSTTILPYYQYYHTIYPLSYQPSRVPSRDKWQHDMFEKEEQEANQAEGGEGEEEQAGRQLDDIEENIEINEGGLDVQDASAFEEKEAKNE